MDRVENIRPDNLMSFDNLSAYLTENFRLKQSIHLSVFNHKVVLLFNKESNEYTLIDSNDLTKKELFGAEKIEALTAHIRTALNHPTNKLFESHTLPAPESVKIRRQKP